MITYTEKAYSSALDFYLRSSTQGRDSFLRAWHDGHHAVCKHGWPDAPICAFDMTVLADPSSETDVQRTFRALFEYACGLKTPHARDFLYAWHAGEYGVCRKEWPDAPESLYLKARLSQSLAIEQADSILKAAGLPSYKDVMDSLTDLDDVQFFDPEDDSPDENIETLKLGVRVAITQYGTGDLGDIDHEGEAANFSVRPANNV